MTGSVSGSIASGGITSSFICFGAIDANALATDAITSPELSSSAISEIADAVLGYNSVQPCQVHSVKPFQSASTYRNCSGWQATVSHLDAGASSSNSFMAIKSFVSHRALENQSRVISAHGTSKVVTVSVELGSNTRQYICVCDPGLWCQHSLTPSAIATAVWEKLHHHIQHRVPWSIAAACAFRYCSGGGSTTITLDGGTETVGNEAITIL